MSVNARLSARKRLAAFAAAGVLCLACFGVAGCAQQTPEPSSAVAGTETTPRLLPAQHQKYVDRTAYKCYSCHGASERGNPTAAGAVALPDGHYVDNDPSSFKLDPIRNECRSCHSVDSGKQMGSDDVFEQAEVETGQDKLDEQ